MAGNLQAWLDRNEARVPVRTAVVLTHERAAVLSCHNPGVDLVTIDVDELLRRIRALATALNDQDRDRIEALIRRDHRHHDKKRAPRSAS